MSVFILSVLGERVKYEAGETVVEPVKPQAIVQMENDTPAAGDEPASVPDENPPVVVEAPETALPTDTAEQPTPPPVKGNTTAHKNFRRFQELFPEIVSGQYEYLRLEAGEAYYPLVIHHKYGSHYCMEHYYMQNGDRMYDPYMDFQIDKEAGTLRAFSYENSGTVIRWKDGNLQKNISVVMCGINCSTHVRRQQKNRNSLPGM